MMGRGTQKMRLLVASDIHGHGKLLARLLEQAAYRPGEDRLFLLGDYIDRGPDARGTLELVMKLVEGGAVALLGNHEDMLLSAATGDLVAAANWMVNGGARTLASYGAPAGDAEALLQLFPEMVVELIQHYIPHEHVEFLSSLPLYHEESDYVFVHAGLRPGVPLPMQDSHTLLWSRDPNFWLHPAPCGSKTVVFGHTPAPFLLQMTGQAAAGPRPWFGPQKVCVDTGVYATGVLAVVQLPDKYVAVRV